MAETTNSYMQFVYGGMANKVTASEFLSYIFYNHEEDCFGITMICSGSFHEERENPDQWVLGSTGSGFVSINHPDVGRFYFHEINEFRPFEAGERLPIINIGKPCSASITDFAFLVRINKAYRDPDDKEERFRERTDPIRYCETYDDHLMSEYHRAGDEYEDLYDGWVIDQDGYFVNIPEIELTNRFLDGIVNTDAGYLTDSDEELLPVPPAHAWLD